MSASLRRGRAPVGLAALGNLRDDEGEGGAPARPGPQRDFPAVVRGDVLDDAEPEPGPSRGTGPGSIHPVEPLEHALLGLLGDADALVHHGDCLLYTSPSPRD